MMAWTRAERNDDATEGDESGRGSPTKSEPDGNLEDAVRRSMNDLEQERSSIGDAGRSQPSAS